MEKELGVYQIGDVKLQYNTYTLRLLSKLFGLDLSETFEQIGNISKSIEIAINFIIAGAESYNDTKLDEKEACKLIDDLGGLNDARFLEFITFAISVYIPKVEDTEPNKKKGKQTISQ